jgi:hypothetical protein
MPLQNRVTPFGEIIATPHRGLFTGNRGIIHDPASKTLLNRRWTNKAWIVCVCAFKGRRRNVMGTRSWTELFFLDEATAFAAGHRPCFFCRRDDANAFRAAWATGQGVTIPRAGEMDAMLHGERLKGRAKRLHPLPLRSERVHSGLNHDGALSFYFDAFCSREPDSTSLENALAAMPDGVMVRSGQESFLIVRGRALLWSPGGYRAAAGIPQDAKLLTPPSIVRALGAGYRPVLHPSATSSF